MRPSALHCFALAWPFILALAILFPIVCLGEVGPTHQPVE